MKKRPINFRDKADSAFETLLTVTTILSGVYISMAFGWFSNYFTDVKPENLQIAMTGVIFGLIFILPLVVILMSWALSQFRDSVTWRIVSWAGLIYCLTQNFIGIVGLFGFSLILAGVLRHGLTMMLAPLVLFIPPVLGTVLSYRVGIGYSRSLPTAETRRGRYALTALLGVISILAIQGLLGLIGVYFGGLFGGGL